MEKMNSRSFYFVKPEKKEMKYRKKICAESEKQKGTKWGLALL
jgi:hypothetical protein